MPPQQYPPWDAFPISPYSSLYRALGPTASLPDPAVVVDPVTLEEYPTNAAHSQQYLPWDAPAPSLPSQHPPENGQGYTPISSYSSLYGALGPTVSSPDLAVVNSTFAEYDQPTEPSSPFPTVSSRMPPRSRTPTVQPQPSPRHRVPNQTSNPEAFDISSDSDEEDSHRFSSKSNPTKQQKGKKNVKNIGVRRDKAVRSGLESENVSVICISSDDEPSSMFSAIRVSGRHDNDAYSNPDDDDDEYVPPSLKRKRKAEESSKKRKKKKNVKRSRLASEHVDEARDASCHYCRSHRTPTKMKCTYARADGACQYYYCQRCIGIHFPDVTFSAHSTTFICPRCDGTCTCKRCHTKSAEPIETENRNRQRTVALKNVGKQRMRVFIGAWQDAWGQAPATVREMKFQPHVETLTIDGKDRPVDTKRPPLVGDALPLRPSHKKRTAKQHEPASIMVKKTHQT